ncbi:helix-turn-helix transcriptional regulator [Gordonia sp. (in: high G+C Gram-positive bacteria)]|uniref:helix-turn-helix domain-containing protein n=1 Tax=Gordonia sp. (in: high G+C Gram-positive bacteria) TaxID=84139 RepID=UPI001692B510|nr:helix-turn-helix transcriptional regulator [Gordonia sp. (in: high G+C Gram-positive bacteria)]NLG47865.1 helix-turn-helix transcriptional regulator [Gordonia sp. (in: high G+C Gram-positive bacteria)]
MNDRDFQPPSLGELIRTQRELTAMPMRKLAEIVGISNPYLSQIERNLREPSDKVLEAIADQLHLSADSLAMSTRKSDPEGPSEVITAIRRDPDLTRAQRGALEEMYQTFTEVTIANRRRGTAKDDG